MAGHPWTRRGLLASSAVALAGCSGAPGSGGSTPTGTPTCTARGDGTEGEIDFEIRTENRGDDQVDVTLRAVHERLADCDPAAPDCGDPEETTVVDDAAFGVTGGSDRWSRLTVELTEAVDRYRVEVETDAGTATLRALEEVSRADDPFDVYLCAGIRFRGEAYVGGDDDPSLSV